MSLSEPVQRELEVLLATLAEGGLSTDQRSRLAALLREHPEARLFYKRYLEVHVMLEWEAGALASDPAESIVFAPPSFETKPSGDADDRPSAREVGGVLLYLASRPRVWGPVAAMLILVVSLTLVLVLSGNDEPEPIVVRPPGVETPMAGPAAVATLTGVWDAVWDAELGGGARVGDRLAVGQRLLLTEGFAEITTDRGAVAVLEAPAAVELLDNDNAIHLHAGKLVGICETESSKGFLVRTPHMDITDLGTRFGVDASPAYTEVHVYQGEVEAALPSRPSTRQALVANQAARSEAGLSELVAIPPSINLFGWGLGVYRLPGTGLGISEGEVDPAWWIVGDGRGVLEKPIPIKVAYTEHPVLRVPDNDRDVAQWLYSYADNAFRRDHPGFDTSRYVIQTAVELPEEAIDPEAVLFLKYAVDDNLHACRINGEPVAGVDKSRSFIDRKLNYQEIEIPLKETALKRGKNTVEFDIHNDTGPIKFYLFWEIRLPQAQSNRKGGNN